VREILPVDPEIFEKRSDATANRLLVVLESDAARLSENRFDFDSFLEVSLTTIEKVKATSDEFVFQIELYVALIIRLAYKIVFPTI